MPDARRFAPATARNRVPILDVLRRVLPATGKVLEIASGSGEHAVFFAEHLPGLSWIPSDPDPGNRQSVAAWIAHAGLANVRAALDLDVLDEPWPISAVDAMVAINMVHISPWPATLALLDGAASRLAPSAPLFLYGPYKIGGAHTAPSNAAFDERLRAEDPRWGVRDVEAVVDAAGARGFALRETVTMPANNLSLVFRRVG